MTEKTDWEVVDDPGQQGSYGPNGAGGGNGPAATPESLASGLLGPWWRWKIAGFAVIAAAVVAVFVALAGVVALFVAAATILLVVIGKVAQLLRGGAAQPGSGVRRQWHDDGPG